MAKKAKKQEQPADDEQDRDAHITDAYSELKKAKTADGVRKVWEDHYLVIGHRVLGRLLLGQDVESATRTRRSST